MINIIISSRSDAPSLIPQSIILDPQQDLNVSMDNTIPLAIIRGEFLSEWPKDLYIPPEALRIFLETFEGPLDLLLYLIKKQNLDILDIPIADITRQYMQYVELMQDLKWELVAEYLVMAAMLAEIKSRMLLPRHEEETENESDPRAELVSRLQEYERFKNAAMELDKLPQLGRDVFKACASISDLSLRPPLPEIKLHELLKAFRTVIARSKLNEHHQVHRESMSIQERMVSILDKIRLREFTDFTSLFNLKEGRLGVVVSFLALLELLKQSLIEIIQTDLYSPIHIKAL